MVVAIVLIVSYGAGLWLVIRPGCGFWSTVGWIVGCYAVAGIVYAVRCQPGVGAAPVRIVDRMD